ncbi:Palmitoyltransferase zdhhc21 [Branchiostoma belcheri]|nr:Palmitoyltransferase zdhhc21 [Branchiostoma belcheri]
MPEGPLCNLLALCECPGTMWEGSRLRLPCGVRVRFLYDPQGWCALAIISFIWAYNTVFIPSLVIMPMYHDNRLPLATPIFYFLMSSLTVVCLYLSVTTNPGTVPLDIQPSAVEAADWTVCKVCQIRRPPRSHHCRRCQQCVRKMDHHCPWINNCVGEENHWLFMQLLYYTLILVSLSIALAALHLYYSPPCSYCNPDIFPFSYTRPLLWFTCGQGVFFFPAAIGLVFGQTFNIIIDRTTLENLADPYFRSGVPSPRAIHEAFSDICGTKNVFCWLWPIRRRRAITAQAGYSYYRHM